jgi:hypothetical protein
MTVLAEIHALLTRWLLWLRLRRGVQWGGRGLVLGLGLALLAAALIIPRLTLVQEEYYWVAASLALAGLIVGASAGFVWPTDRVEAARFFDHHFGLYERVSAALELDHETPEPGSLRHAVLSRQRADALQAARQADYRRRLPLRLSWWELGASLLLASTVILAAAWWGEPYFKAAERQRLIKAAIDEERQQVEELRSEIEQLQSLAAEQQEDLLGPLDEAIQSLQGAETLEQAVSALSSAEQELRLLADQAALDQREALQQVGQALAAEQGSLLQGLGQMLANGDLQAAAQALAELDLAALSPEAAAQAAQELRELAGALENTNPELAQDLNQAAEELSQGNARAAQEALAQAAETMERTGQQAAQAQAAQGAARQLASQTGSLLSSQGLSQTPGNQAGQNGNGSSPGRGEGEGQEGQGAETGQDPIDPNNGPGDGGERSFQELYIPQRLGGETGDTVALPGSGEPGDEVIGERDQPPGEGGEARTPYVDALPAYREALRRAIESGGAPVHLRSLIRDYFSSLEP